MINQSKGGKKGKKDHPCILPSSSDERALEPSIQQEIPSMLAYPSFL